MLRICYRKIAILIYYSYFPKNQAFIEIRESNDFLDVTLVCEDNEQMRAHKVILSACSTFFRALLQCNPHQHPLIYLRGVRFADLQNIVDFMYHGEVNVAQDELNSFLEVAEDLKIKGLSQNLSASTPTGKRKDFSPSRSVSPTYIPQPVTPSLKGGLTPNPPNKRSRRDLTNSTNNLNRNVWLFYNWLSKLLKRFFSFLFTIPPSPYFKISRKVWVWGCFSYIYLNFMPKEKNN